jgi:hypothetical protein
LLGVMGIKPTTFAEFALKAKGCGFDSYCGQAIFQLPRFRDKMETLNQSLYKQINP